MAEAKNFRAQSGGIKEIIQRALATLAFFSSEQEQEILAKDFN